MDMVELLASMIEEEVEPLITPAHTLQDKIKIIYKSAKNNTIVEDQDLKYHAALCVVLMHVEGEEENMVMKELESLNSLSMVLKNTPLGQSAVGTVSENTVGLVRMWKEIDDAD
jgi:hypothetical protein